MVLGIMSGTSADGVDYALCEISPKSIKLKKLWSVSYPKHLRERILNAANNELSSYQFAQLHHDLGRFYADNAPHVKCHYAGLHGQTVFHNPTRGAGATCQIGEPSYLAVKLKVPVINQFRTMDIALGGQGAPLATLFHREVFGKSDKAVAVNNLGGISNVTFLPPSKSGRIFSFDTGPANMLIDLAVSAFSRGRLHFDKGGEWARRGIAYPTLVRLWLRHPFFKKSPPKSTGREEFGQPFFTKALKDCKKNHLNKFDTVATLALLTAESIALSYEKFLPRWPDRVVLCGGGAENPTLKKMITRSLRERSEKPIEVVTSDMLGWPAQSIEAAAFALLAYRTIHGKSGNIPQTTGARREAVLGQITPV